MQTSDHLEGSGPLTIHDYKFLQGDEKYWDVRGAAYNVVAEWCGNRGYGSFNKPTESGKAAMNRFEFFNAG